MKILIVGAGGIGGFFGAKLHQAGADITYLLREQRHQHIQSQGLTVETPRGSFTIRPRVVLANQLEPTYELIILACKAFDLESSIHSIAKASSKGFILPFLNGYSHLDALDRQFGKERVIGGIAHIAATISESGSVKQLTDLNSFTIGPRSPSQEAFAQELFTLCKKADFDSFYKENIEQALWDKWVFLATLAGMTTMLLPLMEKTYADKCLRKAALLLPGRDMQLLKRLNYLLLISWLRRGRHLQLRCWEIYWHTRKMSTSIFWGTWLIALLSTL